MNNEIEKKFVWVIQHTAVVDAKVCFEKELTAVEAMIAFTNGEYEDILDEEIHCNPSEVLDAR